MTVTDTGQYREYGVSSHIIFWEVNFPLCSHFLTISCAYHAKAVYSCKEAASVSRMFSATTTTLIRKYTMSHQNDQQVRILPPSERISPHEKITIWKLDRRQMIAMFVGTLLYIPLMHTLIYVGSYIYPATALALVLGLIFGPWVGLVVGGVGTFLEVLVSIQGHFDMWVAWNPWYSMRYSSFDWEHIVGFALIGFIAGLSALQTQGHFYTQQARSTALYLSGIALLVGLAFSDICSFLIQHTFSSFWIGDDLVTTYFDFVVLILTLVCWGKIKKPFRES